MKFNLLKEKNFSLLMFGKITSLIGSNMQSFALSLFVLSTTGSATKFASILAIALIPQLLLGPFAGVIVDWFYRKNILIVLDLISGIVVTIFAISYFITGEISLTNIYILVIILSLISTIDSPTLQTIIPTITKKEDLVEANALNSLLMSIGSVISPAIAALAYGSLGLKGVFIINSISFFLSALSEVFLVIPRNAKKREKLSFNSFIGEFKEGIGFIVKRKEIINIVTLAIILNFTFGSLTVGSTYISKIILKVSDFQYGIVDSVGVIGMIVASFLIGWLSKKNSIGKNLYSSLLISSAVLSSYAIVAFKSFVEIENSIIYLYLLMLLITFVICLYIGLANTFINIYFQYIVPLEFMGRVSTVMGTGCMIAMPLSNMIYGYLFDKISVSNIFLISSVIMVITMGLYKKSLLSINFNEEVEGKESEADIEPA
ncbi:MAG: MFS transporter [Clostridium sp.]|uniref:MFS transporter n=1 Tax=Clostridium sp. TaxID=1506 RepID=UPI0025C5549D|nr:MFS transporter [Clostridium sp.]MDY2632896.1 MFS transporter [Clostridium sp.]MDY6226935.1 MFS transporter [Clostridium sp.]